MVDSIQGNGRVNAGIKLTNIEKLKNTMAPALGVFGFGNKVSAAESSAIDALAEKFNFNPPKYHKGIEQLVIKDADYIPDDVFKENAYCEV